MAIKILDMSPLEHVYYRSQQAYRNATAPIRNNKKLLEMVLEHVAFVAQSGMNLHIEVTKGAYPIAAIAMNPFMFAFVLDFHRNPDEYNIWSVVSWERFHDYLLLLQDVVTSNVTSREKLEQALRAHRRGDYHASTPLLTALFERSLTDFLRQQGGAPKRNLSRKAQYAAKYAKAPREKAFFEAVAKHSDKYFVNLPTEQVCYTKARNAIAHGDDDGIDMKHQSEQFILWYASLLTILFCRMWS